MIDLFNRSETVIRPTGEGYYDDDMNFIATNEGNVTIDCNIQPYKKGNTSLLLEDGFRSSDAKIVFSKQQLILADKKDDTLADEMIIDGDLYYLADMMDWTGQTLRTVSLIPEHYEGLFIRRDEVS